MGGAPGLCLEFSPAILSRNKDHRCRNLRRDFIQAKLFLTRESVSGAGPAIVVAQAVARATSAPLIYAYEYVVDDEDAKGEYYNWSQLNPKLNPMPRKPTKP